MQNIILTVSYKYWLHEKVLSRSSEYLYLYFSNAQMTPVRIYGEPYAHKFCTVDIFGNINCYKQYVTHWHSLHMLGYGLMIRSAGDIDF